MPTGRKRDRDAEGVPGGGGKAGRGGGGGVDESGADGDGLESALGRIGERTVDVVAKLRKGDRFKSKMVRCSKNVEGGLSRQDARDPSLARHRL